ncbi:MAG: endonuclease/exonuclease/phosphatase family protein [Candidatus Binatia bacterium]
MDLALTIAGLLVIAASVLPIIRKEVWWIRIFDCPRIQIAIVSVVILAVDWSFRTGSGIGANAFRTALAVCILYQAYMIYPYTLLARRQVERAKNPMKESRFSLLLANVKIDNRNAEALRRIIHECDPDVILMVETDAWWQTELKEFEQTHPFTVQQPQDNAYGMIFFSRLELVNSQVKFRVQHDVPSIRACIRLAAGTEVELHCLHPKPPVPQEDGRSTERDAELLIVGRETREKNKPVVVMGDLNDVAWSRTNYLFQTISGLLDPRIGRGLYNTFDARYPIMRFPLDHFFHSNHFRLITLRRLAYFGSDHFPIYIALSYEPDAVTKQKTERPDQGDEEQATEKIQKAKHPV